MPEYGYFLTRIFPCENRIYETAYGKIRVEENPYSGKFYLVIIYNVFDD